ncbi:hypothetical protein UCREL1_5218 [Eutypa lata UCREL1]|uniref:Uncharacterized protein n=1 Tax=Eutypa lata (strain UCR-EL1) TaxID=1287681 RepID=M7SU27_EUTLA|nr:hypothetical protein UCREL1_5218 [Eutypa lata UCREL1]
MDGGDTSQDSTLSKGGAVIEPVPSKEVTTETKIEANSTESSDAEVDESTTLETPPSIPTIFETFEQN